MTSPGSLKCVLLSLFLCILLLVFIRDEMNCGSGPPAWFQHALLVTLYFINQFLKPAKFGEVSYHFIPRSLHTRLLCN